MLDVWFQKIRQVPILEVVSFLKLDENIKCHGKNEVRSYCILPIHQGPNNTGTAFSVDKTKNTWYCFGCKIGGGNIELVKEILGCSTMEAADQIAKYKGYELSEDMKERTPEEYAYYKEQIEEKNLVFEILHIAAHHFHKLLTSDLRNNLLIPQGTFQPRDTWKNIYETWRFDDDVINQNLIGFDDGYTLLQKLEKSYSTKDILKSGLYYKSENELISSFKNRLTFPCRESGNIVNFIARSTCKVWPCQKKNPSIEYKKNKKFYSKYKKLPLHSIEKRPYISHLLQPPFFGISNLRGKKNGIIVEGVTDFILLETFFDKMRKARIQDASHWGVGAFLSNKIDNARSEKLAKIAKSMDSLLFLCDREESRQGFEGAKTTAQKMLKEHSVLCAIGVLPQVTEKTDPVIWLKSIWEEVDCDANTAWSKFLQIVRGAKNIVHITIDEKAKKITDTTKEASKSYIDKIKRRYTNQILELVILVPHSEQEDYISLLAQPPFSHKLGFLRSLVKEKRKFDRENFSDKPQIFNTIKERIAGKFLVTDKGIFLEEQIKDPTTGNVIVKYNQLCAEPVIVKDRVHIESEEECAYVTLVWENDATTSEIVVPMDFLQSKNSDKLCKRGIRIISTNTAKIMSEYFEQALMEVPKRRMFKHLGWWKNDFIIPGLLEDEQIFPTIKNFGYRVEPGDHRNGIEAIKILGDVVEGGASYVLLLHILLAPASYLLKLERYRYCLFLLGQTGNYKTTLATMLSTIYGKDLIKEYIRFEKGATDNSLMKKISMVGELPLIVDNYKPNIGGGEKKLCEIISSVVEGKDKLRLDQRSNFMDCPALRSWLIITGEAGIEKDTSTVARCIELEIIKNICGLELLQKAQRKSNGLPLVGYAWLNWLLSSEGKEYSKALLPQWEKYSSDNYQKAVSLGVQNPGRVGSNFACLDMIFSLAVQCPVFSWLSGYSDSITHCLDESMKAMAATTKSAREGVRFLEILRELLSCGECILGKDTSIIREKNRNGTFIGWDSKSENKVYLLAVVALREVDRTSQMNITKNALYRQLEEQGAIAKKGNETTTPKKLGGKTHRVLEVNRDYLFLDEGD